MQLLPLQFLKITVTIASGVLITESGPVTMSVVTTQGIPITEIVSKTEDAPIIEEIRVTENVRMISTGITVITTIKGADTSIMVIGGPGINGTGTQDRILIFTDTEGTIVKVVI